MIIEQFENKPLAHFSYAIVSEKERKIVLIDPSRDPQPYYDFARRHNAVITAVIETHPHADFVSSHLEISRTTGAAIYTSSLAHAKYEHHAFDNGSVLSLGEFDLKALNTPGHSPDSISVVLEKDGKDYAVFTGDTLFIGDSGRPDLREEAGIQTASRETLAKAMYHSLRKVLGSLSDEVIVYPAHGAGSLCGKSLKDALSSTIGEEKAGNWSMQDMPEDEFVTQLLSDQPFIPAYFGFDVEVNLSGAAALAESVNQINIVQQPSMASLGDTLIIDTRDKKQFESGHLSHSINLMATGTFETWLGTLVKPGEKFFLTAGDITTLSHVIKRAAAIGYEPFIKTAFVFEKGQETQPVLDIEYFKRNKDQFTIIDVRNEAEVKAHRVFPESISIPLHELAQREHEIPLTRPVVVHCAGGYRSAAASSLLGEKLDGVTVYDLGAHIKSF